MAPIDWDMLMKLDAHELQNNAELADDMYGVLCDVCITDCIFHFLLIRCIVDIDEWNFAWNTPNRFFFGGGGCF